MKNFVFCFGFFGYSFFLFILLFIIIGCVSFFKGVKFLEKGKIFKVELKFEWLFKYKIYDFGVCYYLNRIVINWKKSILKWFDIY